jgi:hypothetical protein
MYILGKRIIALAFILFVILGNIWLISLFTGQSPPFWTAHAFISGLVVLLVGSLIGAYGYFFANTPGD